MRSKMIFFTLLIVSFLSSTFVFSINLYAKDMTAKDLVNEAKMKISSINVDEAFKMHGKTGIVFLDVREPKKYKSGHIPGSINIPRGLLEFKIDKKIPNKKEKIVIYCKNGGRSSLASYTLQRMGYTNVINLDGGWKAWAKKGYPVD